MRPGIWEDLEKTPMRVQTLTKAIIEWIWKNKQYLNWGTSSGILWVFGIRRPPLHPLSYNY